MIKFENLIKNIFRFFGIEISRFSKKIHLIITDKIDLLIDVGANTAQFAKISRKMGYKQKIISIEPLVSAHKQLLENSKNDKLWIIHDRCAIGSKNEKKIINISKNSYSSSILDISMKHLDSANESTYIGQDHVEVITLDLLFDKYSFNHERIFVKIDTQGFEDQVLNGFKNNIGNTYGIQIELSTVELYKNQKL